MCMNNILNILNVDKLNIKDLTLLLEILDNLKIETKPKNDDIEVI